MQRIQELMIPNPITYPATATVIDAARAMRDTNVGDVLVERDGSVIGIVTDRDLVVRALASARNPADVRLGDSCSRALITLTPNDSVDDAVGLMRDNALRRLPICKDGVAVGIISLGDLAVERDPDSALADITVAPPNT